MLTDITYDLDKSPVTLTVTLTLNLKIDPQITRNTGNIHASS